MRIARSAGTGRHGHKKVEERSQERLRTCGKKEHDLPAEQDKHDDVTHHEHSLTAKNWTFCIKTV